MPPYEKLKSLPEAEGYLCSMITFEALDAIANQMSDNQFAERMVKALRIESLCQYLRPTKIAPSNL